MIKLTAIILTLLITSVNATEFNINKYLSKTYVTIGAGYKITGAAKQYNRKTTNYMVYGPIQESVKTYDRSPISTRIEFGYHYSKNIKFGISHYSQCLNGYPVNIDKKYSKTELFIDYTFYLGK